MRSISLSSQQRKNELVERLKVDGYVLESPEMSIEQLAEKYEADTEAILLLVFH